MNTNDRSMLWAARIGSVEGVKDSLDRGANIEATDVDRCNALMLATAGNHVELVKLLLDRGAKIEATDAVMYSALKSGARAGAVEAVKLLLDRGAIVDAADRGPRVTALMLAACDQKSDAVTKLLLERGADGNAKDSRGFTALHWAANCDNALTVRALLERGVDASLVTLEGWTAEDMAGGEAKEILIAERVERERTFFRQVVGIDDQEPAPPTRRRI